MTLNSVQAECTGYEFAVGAVHGIRSWKIDVLGRLTGVAYTEVWKPAENVAVCKRRKRDPKAPPDSYAIWMGGPPTVPDPCDGNDPDCKCGFYAYHDGIAYYAGGDVSGIIEGSGRTTVGTRGFRCSKARVLALALDEPEPKGVSRKEWALFAAAAVPFLIGCLHPLVTDGPWWLLLSLPMGGLAGFFNGKSISLGNKRRKANRASAEVPETYAKLRRNYPDVTFFPTVEAMVAAYPPDKGLEPSPDNDPDFWNRL